MIPHEDCLGENLRLARSAQLCFLNVAAVWKGRKTAELGTKEVRDLRQLICVRYPAFDTVPHTWIKADLCPDFWKDIRDGNKVDAELVSAVTSQDLQLPT